MTRFTKPAAAETASRLPQHALPAPPPPRCSPTWRVQVAAAGSWQRRRSWNFRDEGKPALPHPLRRPAAQAPGAEGAGLPLRTWIRAGRSPRDQRAGPGLPVQACLRDGKRHLRSVTLGLSLIRCKLNSNWQNCIQIYPLSKKEKKNLYV